MQAYVNWPCRFGGHFCIILLLFYLNCSSYSINCIPEEMSTIFFFFPALNYSGSPLWMRLLHAFMLLAIFGFKFFSPRSPLMLLIYLRLGLPLLLFPCTSISMILLPTWSSPTLILKCPYHLNLDSWIFLEISVTFTVPLMYSFLIWLFWWLFPSTQHLHFRHIHLLLSAILQRCCFKPMSLQVWRTLCELCPSLLLAPLYHNHTRNFSPVIPVTLNPKVHFFFHFFCLIYHWSQVLEWFHSLQNFPI